MKANSSEIHVVSNFANPTKGGAWLIIASSQHVNICRFVKRSTNSPTKAIMVKAKFSIPDYVVFSLMMAVSAGIGLWYGCGPGGKQKTTKEYLLADRQMRIWPVAISLLVSYLSAITLLGVPSEIYTYGAQYYVLILSYFIICSAVAIVFVPMFHRVNVTCANEVRNSWHRV